MGSPFHTNENKTLAVAGALALIGTLLGMFLLISIGVTTKDAAPRNTVAVVGAPSPDFIPGMAVAESDPVRLRIPDIFVDTHFVPLGLQENGEIEIPKGFEEVGWYTKGPTPGEMGPAIVLGHVDSYEGPAVFYSLGQLVPGDHVYVDRADGTTATFEVVALERYDRANFPTEKVYGKTDHAGLRLITCSGTFDKTTQEYDRTLVVYAALVGEKDGQ